MSNVKTEGTDIEEILGECVKKFWKNNRYRKNVKKLPGTPDIVFLRKKIVIFADGDFWHGKYFNEWKDDLPEFWRVKIGKNMERDKKQTKKLKEMGYDVLRFWGSDLKSNKEEVIKKIAKKVNK